MKYNKFIAFILILSFNLAWGEVEKNSLVTEKGISFYWWPHVNAPNGFTWDENASYENSVKIFIEKGKEFSNSETVIYAKAMYKPREKEFRNIAELIKSDIKDFSDMGIEVKELSEKNAINGSGTKLKSFSFYPGKKQEKDINWEYVTYDEDKEYYFIFTISSRSEIGLKKHSGLYWEMINKFK